MIISHFSFAPNGNYVDICKRELEKLIINIQSRFKDINVLPYNINVDYLFHRQNALGNPMGDTIGYFINSTLPWQANRIDDLAKIFPNITTFNKYIIVLSRYLADSRSDIEKCFTIAHEIHHLVQQLLSIENSIKCIILFQYFLLNHDERTAFKLPHDLDAIRRAKGVNYQLFGKDDVDLFINQQIDNNRDYLIYWKIVRDIDPTYDFVKETELLWREYKNNIYSLISSESQIKEILDYCERNNIKLK